MRKSPKSPQQKKAESYEHDRRNVYGENSKSSRKNIRRGKAAERRVERRQGNQALVGADRATSEDVADTMQTAATAPYYRWFQKVPDAPLAEVVSKKLRRRATSVDAKKKRAAERLEAERRRAGLIAGRHETTLRATAREESIQ